jgi:hypothetical protein
VLGNHETNDNGTTTGDSHDVGTVTNDGVIVTVGLTGVETGTTNVQTLLNQVVTETVTTADDGTD